MMQDMQAVFVYEAFKGTIKYDASLKAEKDAEDLRKAMKGLGTDEDVIIDIVGSRTNAQRQEIEKVYKQKYGRDLKEDLKKELSGNFEDTIVALFYPPAEYDVRCLHDAMHGAGTDEEVLIEILASRSKEELKEIKEIYQRKHNESLENAIKGDTSGHFKRLLTILLQGNRETGCVDEDQAKKEAKELYDAGEKHWGTDESKFIEILANRSFPQLRATFYYYAKHTGHSILHAIDNEFSGDMKDGLEAIVLIAYNSAMYFAHALMRSMEGLGTNDSTLIRIIVSRSEVDMHEIKKEFEKMTKKPLYKWIKDDTSGDYKKILLVLIDE